MEYITLAGGCFWCLEAVFADLQGVKSVVCGYSNGDKPNPTYKEVCTGTTGYAEVIRIEFDENKLSVDKILRIFWHIHDPTSLNRQGADIGTQYRTAIFYEKDSHKTEIEESLQQAQKEFSKPIVTVVQALKNFFVAEDYHQNYYKNNPNEAYCQAVIAPKIQKSKSI